MASVTYRKDRAFWEAKVRYKGFDETKTFPTKTAAKKWARNTEADIDRKLKRKTNRDAPQKLEELVERYTEDMGWPFSKEEKLVAPTQGQYSTCCQLRKMSRIIGHVELEDLTPAYLYNFALSLSEDRKVSKKYADGTTRKMTLKGLSKKTIKDWWTAGKYMIAKGRNVYGVQLRECPFEESAKTLRSERVIGASNERDRRAEVLKNYTYLGTNPEFHGQTFDEINEIDVIRMELGWQDHWLLYYTEFSLASTMRLSHIHRMKKSDVDFSRGRGKAGKVWRQRKAVDDGKTSKTHEWGLVPKAGMDILFDRVEKLEREPEVRQQAREELYEQVWSIPTRKLANELGMSDSGITKLCRRMNIPKPPRGYWAKLKAGKKVKKQPLPKMSADEMDDDLLWDYPMTPKAVGQAFKDLTERLGFGDFTFHCLRHEGTSRLVEDKRKFDIELIMEVTGHHDVRSLARYTQKLRDHAQEKFGDEADAL